jgi:hypothetical protein
MQLTEADQNLIGSLTLTQERLSALPQDQAVVQALEALRAVQRDYEAAVAAVNAVEREINEYERVARDAANNPSNPVGMLPNGPSDLERWSRERARLQQLMRDTREVIESCLTRNLTPAREQLDWRAEKVREALNTALTVEFQVLRRKKASGEKLTDSEQLRLENVVLRAGRELGMYFFDF